MATVDSVYSVTDGVAAMSEIAQTSGVDLLKKFGSAVSVAGDAVKPFLPLIAVVTVTITEIIRIYDTAQHNKRMCGAMHDRVIMAQAAIKLLERRQKENEEKFKQQNYYDAFLKFVALLKKIRDFLQDVSQLKGFKKFKEAGAVEIMFTKLASDFDSTMSLLHFAVAISTEDQQQLDREAVTKDLEDIKNYLDNIAGGITTMDHKISSVLEEISIIKDKVAANKSADKLSRTYEIPPDDLVDPADRRPNDARDKDITRKYYKFQDVAVKKLALPDKKTDDGLKVAKELTILKSLQEGQRIIKFYGTSVVDGAPVMVFEWAEKGSLKDYYEATRPEDFPWDLKLKLALDICRGIAFLHETRYLHHDIRCQNVLLTDDFVAKLANFKLSRGFNDKSTAIKIFDHLPWLAPEKLRVLGREDKERVPYTQKCEIYSYGLLLWELGHQRVPYKGKTPNQIEVHVLADKRESFQWDLGPLQQGYTKIIRDAWQGEPRLRPTISELFLELNKLQKTFYPEARTPSFKPATPPATEISSLSLDTPVLGDTYRKIGDSPHRKSVSLNLPSCDLPPEFEFELFVPVEEIIPLDEGITAHRGGDKEKAWKCFEAHAKLDNPQAIYWKGYYLWEGYVVAKNRTEAAELFKQAADDGIADAQLRYAFCMVNSEGIKFDKDLFMHYLILSADNGNPSARYNLADVYLNGKLGIPKNEQEGVKYLRLAALKDQPKAREMLKVLKAKGVDVGDLNDL